MTFQTISEWLPIKTAPQDGTKVLITDGKDIWISSQRIGAYAGTPRNGMSTTGHEFSTLRTTCITHWMPLPDLPKDRAP